MALTLTKKSDAAVVVVPPWHPNLRIVENLPDTKVVRTAFFVNGVAMSVAIALALYLGIQEWKLHEVNKQISDWQHQIDSRPRRERRSRRALPGLQAGGGQGQPRWRNSSPRSPCSRR